MGRPSNNGNNGGSYRPSSPAGNGSYKNDNTTGATQVAPIAVAAEAVAVAVLMEVVAAPAAVEAVNILISSIERFSTIFLL